VFPLQARCARAISISPTHFLLHRGELVFSSDRVASTFPPCLASFAKSPPPARRLALPQNTLASRRATRDGDPPWRPEILNAYPEDDTPRHRERDLPRRTSSNNLRMNQRSSAPLPGCSTFAKRACKDLHSQIWACAVLVETLRRSEKRLPAKFASLKSPCRRFLGCPIPTFPPRRPRLEPHRPHSNATNSKYSAELSPCSSTWVKNNPRTKPGVTRPPDTHRTNRTPTGSQLLRDIFELRATTANPFIPADPRARRHASDFTSSNRCTAENSTSIDSVKLAPSAAHIPRVLVAQVP